VGRPPPVPGTLCFSFYCDEEAEIGGVQRRNLNKRGSERSALALIMLRRRASKTSIGAASQNRLA